MSDNTVFDWREYLRDGAALDALNAGQQQMAKNFLSNAIPRFAAEGDEPCRILYVGAEPSRFDENELCICVYCYSAQKQQGDWWRGSLSQQYAKGNNADKTYQQLTIDCLKRLGWDGQSFATITQLVGKETSACVKATERNGRTYYNIGAIGTSNDAPKVVSLADLASRLPAAGAPPSPAPAFAPTAPAVAPMAPVAPAAPAPAMAPAAPPNPFGGNNPMM